MQKIIITGSTGMVGEGVLHVSLSHPLIEKVLVINRRSCGVAHPKLKEIIHQNFFELAEIESEFTGYDACLFCLGVSSIGLNRQTYYEMTYTLTMNMAATLSRLNNQMTFEYISGAGTDSSEKASSNWARIKGKTENDLMKLPFKKVHAFRPGFIKPIENLTRTKSFYHYIGWLFPLGRMLYSKAFCTLNELALAMIYTATHNYEKNIIEGKDIIELAKKETVNLNENI